MDIVLLPTSPPRSEHQETPLEADLDFQQLSSWLDRLQAWIEANPSRIRIYAYLPEQLAALETIHRLPHVDLFLMVKLKSIDIDWLTQLSQSQIRKIILIAPTASQEMEIAPLQLLHDFLGKHPSISWQWWLWLPLEKMADNHERVRAYQQSGFPFEAIEAPAWSLETTREQTTEEEATRVQAMREEAIRSKESKLRLPQKLRNLPISCSFFENTLTLTTAGTIYPCPEYWRTGFELPLRNLDLGNLDLGNLDNPPEDLILKKAEHLPDIGKHEVCVRCHLRSRFDWPQTPFRKVRERLTQDVQESKRNAFLQQMSQLQSAQKPVQNLATVDPETKQKELDRFEQLLNSWSDQMTEQEPQTDDE